LSSETARIRKKFSGGDNDGSLTEAKSAIHLLIDGAAID